MRAWPGRLCCEGRLEVVDVTVGVRVAWRGLLVGVGRLGLCGAELGCRSECPREGFVVTVEDDDDDGSAICGAVGSVDVSVGADVNVGVSVVVGADVSCGDVVAAASGFGWAGIS